MEHKPSITIGIPAFNEEANIGHLIHDILTQDMSGYILEKIVIASDGSTDNTISILNAIQAPQLEVLDNKDRKGQSARQNQIIERTTSDILVLLNADILIKDKHFIYKLIQPVYQGKADLSSSALEILPGRNFIEKTLRVGFEAKTMVFEQVQGAQNIYTCHGAARAFSKKLYQNFRFKNSVGEDAYSYLYTVYNGYRYGYVKDAIAYIRYADNLEDHKKQSLRFAQSKKQFTSEFGDEFVRKQYDIPLQAYVVPGMHFMLKNPIAILAYGLFFLKSSFEKIFSHTISDTWSISTSSKSLR